MIQLHKLPSGIAILTFDNAHGSANVLNTPTLLAFEKELDRAHADQQVRGIIVASAKKDFILGGDLEEIYALENAEQVRKLLDELHRIFRKLEAGGKPAVAALNGTTLGGGYELALACQQRIMVNHPKALIGLPEVTLGLLPGGGGTQRLPRLIGLQAALLPLLEGKKYRPEEALKLGMVDELVQDAAELISKAEAWLLANLHAEQPWDRKGFTIKGGNMHSTDAMNLITPTAGIIRQKTFGNYPAPMAILDALYEGIQLDFDRSLQLEARHFTRLALSKEAKHMMKTLWFSMNNAKAGVTRPKSIAPTQVKKIGILGAGMMGAGIAYVSANVGIEVVLKDISVENAEKGKDYSRKLLTKKLERGFISQEKVDTMLDRISASEEEVDLKGCDLVVEAVFEDRGLKAKVTQAAEAQLSEEAVFASNTSTLPISGLAEASVRPPNFIGLHFFSPVDKMQLVEVIMGKETSDFALAVAMDYVRQIGRIPIVVNDGFGFYTSRIFKTYVVEGCALLYEGVKPALIDNAGKMAGMPVGPLAVADEVSLELLYKISKQAEKDGYPVDEARKQVVYKMVGELGRLGRKNGKGFYEYPAEGGAESPYPDLQGKKYLWPGLSEHFPPAKTQPQVEEVKKRLLHIQALESWRALEEGILRSPEDGDVGSILGWGFPPYTGGTLSYIDFTGIDTFVKECDDFADRFGERFRPTDGLRKKVK